jgi:hypothetical protein
MQKFINGLKYLMAIFYMAIGLWILTHPSRFGEVMLDPMIGRLIGGILVAYGLFRFYRAYTTDRPQE